MPVRGKRSIADTYVSILPETSRVAAEIAKAFRATDKEAREAGKRWKEEINREVGKIEPRLHVTLDKGQALADAERLKQTVERMKPTMHVDVDRSEVDRVGDAFTAGIGNAFKNIDLGKLVGGGGGAAGGMAGAGSQAGSSFAGGFGPAAMVGIAAALVGVAGIAASTAGVIGLIPAAATGAAAGIGTLALAFDGFGDVMSNIKDPEKFAESLGQIAPGAQAVALSLRDLMPMFDQLKFTVSDAFFTPLVGAIKPLAETYLPLVRTGLSQMGSVMGTALSGLAQFLQTPAMMSAASTMTNNLVQAFSTFSGVLQPVVGAMTQIGVIGSQFLPQLAGAAVQAAQGFSQMVGEAAASGKLGDWIQTGITSLGQLFDLLMNLGPALGSLAPLGTALLPFLNQMVVALTPGLAAIGSMLASLVTGMSPVLTTVASLASTVLGALAPAFATWVNALTPVVQQILGALNPALQALGPVLTQVANVFAGQLASSMGQIGPMLVPLAKSFGDLMIAVLPLVPQLAQLAIAVLPNFAAALSAILPYVVQFMQNMSSLAQQWMPLVSVGLSTLSTAFSTAFGAIKVIVETVWNVIQPIFSAIGGAIDRITAPLQNLINLASRLPGVGGAVNAIAGLPNVLGPSTPTPGSMSPGAHAGVHDIPANLPIASLPPGWTPPVSPYAPVATPPVSSYIAPPLPASGGSSKAASAASPIMVSPDNAMAAIGLAQDVNGTPYQMGGTGPTVYDCSGFMSDLYAAMTGQSYDGPRLFTTESDFSKLGFVPGYQEGAFNIGVHNGGGGANSHMAGTLPNGVNVEATSGQGARYGGPAHGALDKQFEKQYHLPVSSAFGSQLAGMAGSNPMAAAMPDGSPMPAGLRDAYQRVDDRNKDVEKKQARLNELRSSGKATALQLANAEDALARAQREAGDAADDLATKQKKLSTQQGKGKGSGDFAGLGQDLMSGIMQVFGFDGSVFGDPSQFGITKLFSGLTNWATQPAGGANGGSSPMSGGGAGGGGGLLDAFMPQAFGALRLGSQADAPTPFVGGMPGHDGGNSLAAGAQFAGDSIQGAVNKGAQPQDTGNGHHYGDVINIQAGGGGKSVANDMYTNHTVPRARQAVRQ